MFCEVKDIKVVWNYVTLCCEKGCLTMVVSEDQAKSILIALNKEKFERPLTHDLFVTFLRLANISILNVTIYKLEKGIYYAYILC